MAGQDVAKRLLGKGKHGDKAAWQVKSGKDSKGKSSKGKSSKAHA